MLTKYRQRGDTLVEVLICIMLVSVILTGAYVTTNRSSLAIRDSQEHAEALKLIQGQLEQIRHNSTQPTTTIFDQSTSTNFCMVGAAVTTGEGCTRSAADQHTNANQQANAEGVPYQLTINRKNCAPANTDPNCHTFVVKADWDSITAKSTTSEQLSVRIHHSTSNSAANGNAALFKDPCQVSACPNSGPPPNGGYYYFAGFTNLSNNPPSEVTGCIWDWGDGTSDSNVSCYYNDQLGHDYPALTNPLPYPQDCGKNIYTLTLTVFVRNAPAAKDTYTLSRPNCL